LQDCKSLEAGLEDKDDAEEDEDGEEDGRGTTEPTVAACDCHH
jgi:hypothetical protein